MESSTLDRDLLDQLELIPEVELAGFSVREGLAGSGVTLLRGRSYIGSWRATDEELIWVPANLAEPGRTMPTVEEALRFTLLLILKNIEDKSPKPQKRAQAG